jgi:hypothetical protein
MEENEEGDEMKRYPKIVEDSYIDPYFKKWRK